MDKGLEDCPTCKSKSFCYMLKFAVVSKFVHYVDSCPCRSCLIKPVCLTSCEDRKVILRLNEREAEYFSRFKIALTSRSKTALTSNSP